jgi:hypothetical protein
LGGYFQNHRETRLDRAYDARGHLRGRLSVHAPHAAPLLRMPASGVAHDLVNHAAGDAGVLQPRREGVPQVVRAVQVEVGKAPGVVRLGC